MSTFLIAGFVLLLLFFCAGAVRENVFRSRRRQWLQARSRSILQTNRIQALNPQDLLAIPWETLDSLCVDHTATGIYQVDRDRLVIIDGEGRGFVGFATQANLYRIREARLRKVEHAVIPPFVDLTRKDPDRWCHNTPIRIGDQQISIYPCWFLPDQIDEDWCRFAALQREFFREKEELENV